MKVTEILGVQPDSLKHVAQLNERLRGVPAKAGRDLLRATGEVASVSVQATPCSPKNAPVKNWRLACVDNPSRVSVLHAHRWAPVSTATQQEAKQCDHCEGWQSSLRAGEEYNKAACVPRPTESFYKTHIAVTSNLTTSTTWTHWETEYLLDLLAQYELRFHVVHDRFDPATAVSEHIERRAVRRPDAPDPLSKGMVHPLCTPSMAVMRGPCSNVSEGMLSAMSEQDLKSLQARITSGRSFEELKARFYDVARIAVQEELNRRVKNAELMTADHPAQEHRRRRLIAAAKDEINRNPFLKIRYFPLQDRQRRAYLERSFTEPAAVRRQTLVTVAETQKLEASRQRQKDAKVKKRGEDPTEFLDSVSAEIAASVAITPNLASTYALTQLTGMRLQHRQEGAVVMPTIKKTDQKLEAKAKAIGIGSLLNDLHENGYFDLEIAESCGELRQKVAELVALEMRIDGLEAAKNIWTSNLIKLRDEGDRPDFDHPSAKRAQSKGASPVDRPAKKQRKARKILNGKPLPIYM